MVKGWRNSPEWIAHYAARDKARIERQIERLQIEVRMQQQQAAMRSLREPMNFAPHV